jgi:hypothetical protein
MDLQNILKEILDSPAQQAVLKDIKKAPYVNSDNKGAMHKFGGRFHRAKEVLLNKQVIRSHGNFCFSLTSLGEQLFTPEGSLITI